MTEIANQLNSQTLGDVLPSAFKQVGAAIFPDRGTVVGLNAFRDIVHSWVATHSPLSGNVGPSTGTEFTVTAASTDVAVDLVAPATQEVIQINALMVKNGGGTPATVSVKLGNTVWQVIVANPASDTPAGIYAPLILSAGQSLTITVTAGTATDITGYASGVKSCV